MGSSSITLLMANYNNGPYLRTCFDSVLAQTSDRWQVLLIDDASTDNSQEIYEEYREQPNFTFRTNEENLGYIGTLKRLIKEAETDIVAIIDPDDALVETAVEQLMNTWDANPDSGFIYTNFWYCDAELNKERPGFCRAIPKGKSSLDKNCVSHIKSFRCSVYDQTAGYDESILYAEDKDLVLKMEEAGPMVFVDEPLYLYRVLPSSQSHGKRRAVGKKNYELARRRARARRIEKGIPMSPYQRCLAFIDRLKFRNES